jgi:cell division protein FtsB
VVRNRWSSNGNGLAMKLIWKRIVKYSKFTVLFTTVAAVAILAGEKSLTHKSKLGEKRAQLQKENQILAVEIRSLERKVTLLRNDPKTIQKVAKKKLGMARPDETVYIFDTSQRSSAGAGN